MSDNWADEATKTYSVTLGSTGEYRVRLEACMAQRTANQQALDYCNGEMKNCLAVVDEQAGRITELERREAVYQELAVEADRMLGEGWWEVYDNSIRAAELFSQIILWRAEPDADHD